MWSLDKKRIYFLGACGTAMASLAAMLRQKGHEVYGSDSGMYPPISDFLVEQSIPVFEEFDTGHLDPPPDLVVVGNVISRGNVEIEEILDRHIPYISLPDALREFLLDGKRSIVVTGTHGKTSTSSLLAWIFEFGERRPNFMIGGIPENFSRGFQLDDGDDFIIEGDEYDSAFFDKTAKFLHYRPDIGVIKAIEYDHADIYNSLDDIKVAFQRFVNLLPRRGLLAYNGDDSGVEHIARRAYCPIVSFGLTSKVEWRAASINSTLNSTSFQVWHKDRLWGEAELSQPGIHSVRNALAAIVVSDHVGIAKETILEALERFKGVKRRLQRIGEARGIEIYDDFAHHPTAICETLAAFRALYKTQRLWALYEPRSATSRRNIFQNEFVDAFQDADVILVAPVHRPDKAPKDQLFSSHKLVENLRSRGKIAENLTPDEMITFTRNNAKKGDVVVTFSNGPFDGIQEKLLYSL